MLRHTPLMHWLPAQSTVATQVRPTPQGPHVPPQSIAVSPTSSTSFEQWEGASPASCSLNSKFGNEHADAITPTTARSQRHGREGRTRSSTFALKLLTSWSLDL